MYVCMYIYIYIYIPLSSLRKTRELAKSTAEFCFNVETQESSQTTIEHLISTLV